MIRSYAIVILIRHGADTSPILPPQWSNLDGNLKDIALMTDFYAPSAISMYDDVSLGEPRTRALRSEVEHSTDWATEGPEIDKEH